MDENGLSNLIEGFLDEETENLEMARSMCKDLGKYMKHIIMANKIDIIEISRNTSIPINKINKILDGDINAKILDIIKIARFLDIDIQIKLN